MEQMTTLRLGATKVQIVCLESRREMPAYPWEIQESLEEGIEIFNSWAPQEVLNQEGRVSAPSGLRIEADGSQAQAANTGKV